MSMAETSWACFAMLAFMLIDYLTGVIKGAMRRKLSSRLMKQGLLKKFATILLALTAWIIDLVGEHVRLGLPVSIFVCVTGGICLVEITSIIENIAAINPRVRNAKFLRFFDAGDDGVNVDEVRTRIRDGRVRGRIQDNAILDGGRTVDVSNHRRR